MYKISTPYESIPNVGGWTVCYILHAALRLRDFSHKAYLGVASGHTLQVLKSPMHCFIIQISKYLLGEDVVEQ